MTEEIREETSAAEPIAIRKERVIDQIYTQLNRIANCTVELADRSDKTDPAVIERLQDNIDDATHRLQVIEQCHLPSGHGFDAGTLIYMPESGLTQVANWRASNKHQDVIRLKSHYHHMDEMGGYGDWSELKIAIRPCFLAPGFTLRITTPTYGNVRSMRDMDIDYWHDEFYAALTEEVEVPVYVNK